MKIDWGEFYIEIIRIDARIYDWKKIERANIFLFDQFDFIYLIILQMQMATWIYVNFSKETGNIKNRRYQQWYIYISLFFSLSFATKVTRFKCYKFLRKENILPLCIPINENYMHVIISMKNCSCYEITRKTLFRIKKTKILEIFLRFLSRGKKLSRKYNYFISNPRQIQNFR